jgi:hypothetical protein
MATFSPELLDDSDALRRADRGGLLRGLASAGALVRRARETLDDFGVSRLSDRPRALLVATDSHAPYLSNLLGVLAGMSCPVLDWREPVLPRWAGPADALILVSADGRHPRLAELLDQADRRGMAIATAAPADSPVGVIAGRYPLADLSHLAAAPPRSTWWALAVPAIQAATGFGLIQPDGEDVADLSELADALDQVAETNRPDSSAFTGPAKVLATDLAEAVPVIAGSGRGATVAARRVAGAIQLIGGSTAMAASLPDDVARVGSLLEFAAVDADFFADRVANTATLPRLVLIGGEAPAERGIEPPHWEQLGDEAARRAGQALADLASQRGIAASRIDVPDAPMLTRFAVASAVGDFAACYLALGRDIDPSAPRLGELPH